MGIWKLKELGIVKIFWAVEIEITVCFSLSCEVSSLVGVGGRD